MVCGWILHSTTLLGKMEAARELSKEKEPPNLEIDVDGTADYCPCIQDLYKRFDTMRDNFVLADFNDEQVAEKMYDWGTSLLVALDFDWDENEIMTDIVNDVIDDHIILRAKCVDHQTLPFFYVLVRLYFDILRIVYCTQKHVCLVTSQHTCVL